MMMAGDMKVKHVDLRKDRDEWQEAISSSDQNTFFHSPYWLGLIEESYGLEPHHLLVKGNVGGKEWEKGSGKEVERRGEKEAEKGSGKEVEKRGVGKQSNILAFPLFSSDKGLHSPFMADYGGSCINREIVGDMSRIRTAFECLKREIDRTGKKKHAPALYVRGYFANDVEKKVMAEAGFTPIVDHLTFVLSDFFDVEDVISIFDSKTRRPVRKALRTDMEVEEIEPKSEAMEEYYKLHVMTKKGKHDTEPFPRKFFDLLSTVPSENLIILMAKQGNDYIAGLLVFPYNGRIHVVDNCSNLEFRRLKPNNLLYYYLIEKAKKMRMDVDFGRTSPEHKGLRDFKEGWGGKAYQYSTYRKILPPVALNMIKLGLKSVRKDGSPKTSKDTS